MGRFIDFIKLLVEKKTGGYAYSCLMLDLPNTLTNEIIKHIEEDDLHEYSNETDCHVTIKYGLHTNDGEDVLKYVKGTKLSPIDLKIHNFSLFENEEYDVLKLDVKSKDLRKLNKMVCDEFEYTDNFPTYNPHVTISYLKKGMGKKYIKLLRDKFPNYGENMTSNKFIFSPSKGDKIKKNL